jgi:hypothetical protein
VGPRASSGYGHGRSSAAMIAFIRDRVHPGSHAAGIAVIRSRYDNVRRMVQLFLILVVISFDAASCTGPEGKEKNLENLCSELSAISKKLGDNINKFDDISRQMTIIVKISTRYNDNIQIIFVLEKVNLLRIIASYERHSLELLCHVQDDYRGDFCQERIESLQRAIGLATLHVETLQDISQKIANDAARYQIEEMAKTLRSTLELYRQSSAIFQSVRLSE